MKWLSLILILFGRCLLKKEGILHDNGHVHVILTVVAKQRNFTVVPSQPTADAWSSNEIMAHTCKKSKLQHIPARRWRRRVEFTWSWNQQLHMKGLDFCDVLTYIVQIDVWRLFFISLMPGSRVGGVNPQVEFSSKQKLTW